MEKTKKTERLVDVKRVNNTPWTRKEYRKFLKERGEKRMTRGTVMVSEVLNELRIHRESLYTRGLTPEQLTLDEMYHKHYGNKIKSYWPSGQVFKLLIPQKQFPKWEIPAEGDPLAELYEVRAMLADWMIEVIEAFSQDGPDDQTYFKAMLLLDIMISKKNIITTENIHLYGIACICIASKLLDYAPIDLRKCYEDVCHKEYKRDEILKAINYVLAATAFEVDVPSWAEFLDKLIFDIFGNFRGSFGTFNVRQVSLFVLHCMILDVKYYNFHFIRVVGMALAYTLGCYFQDYEAGQVANEADEARRETNLAASRQRHQLLTQKICEHICYPESFLIEDLRDLGQYMEDVRESFGATRKTAKLAELYGLVNNNSQP